ncbi:MAG: UDP-N-acetylmuramoyl-L-alanyl-D-glutamate--2,6-diaminopimelate ligase [Patescibacteria group bacterium]|nr:UDP-N-acetylmuramoyl-L-alanyl-D-glutamate--2,6-diaminopimelate ligase [Patescibacteria group bacterium]
MLKLLRQLFPDTGIVRLTYHKMWACMAAIVYLFPARKLKVIAVTGTNGKTTTVNLLAQTLTGLGKRVGMTSTVNFQIGDKVWSNRTKKTTQGRFDLQKLLRRMVKAGCEYAIIEVSSHAMTQSRMFGVKVDVAVMTNMSDDHIEYHGSFEKYRAAKGKLFKKFHKYSVLNMDDPGFDYFNSINRGKKVTYGIKKGDFHLLQVSSGPAGSEFLMHTNEGDVTVSLAIPGFVNIYNALAAFAAISTFGFKYEDIAKALSNAKGAPGRFERVEIAADFDVVVDYAHDQVSLEKLLTMCRELSEGRILHVFGATGGGRDKQKRPKMGTISDKYADMIFLTNDDPYNEDPHEIIEMIAEGISRDQIYKNPDRRVAIHTALSQAQPGDMVVISGKGGEEVIVIGDEKLPWDDRQIVQEFFKHMNQ